MLNHLPNLLTLLRVAFIPAIYVVCIYEEGALRDWLGVAIISVAGATDFFDGWLARRFNVQSSFGKMLDPIADKAIVIISLMLLVYDRTIYDLHLIGAALIICREILVSGLREYLVQINIGLPVSKLAKYKTTVQMVAIGFLMAIPSGENFFRGATEVAYLLLWISVALTLISSRRYVSIAARHMK